MDDGNHRHRAAFRATRRFSRLSGSFSFRRHARNELNQRLNRNCFVDDFLSCFKIVILLAVLLLADFPQGLLDQLDGGSRVKDFMLVEVDIFNPLLSAIG